MCSSGAHYLDWEASLITSLGFGFDIKDVPNLNSKKIHNIYNAD